MTKKEAFINMVEDLLRPLDIQELNKDNRNKMAFEFFEELKAEKIKPKAIITENGIKILTFMRDNKDKYNNVFKARDIAEGLFTSSRSVSGSMRKLITGGFVEKVGQDPVVYAITDKGLTVNIADLVEVSD